MRHGKAIQQRRPGETDRMSPTGGVPTGHRRDRNANGAHLPWRNPDQCATAEGTMVHRSPLYESDIPVDSDPPVAVRLGGDRNRNVFVLLALDNTCGIAHVITPAQVMNQFELSRPVIDRLEPADFKPPPARAIATAPVPSSTTKANQHDAPPTALPVDALRHRPWCDGRRCTTKWKHTRNPRHSSPRYEGIPDPSSRTLIDLSIHRLVRHDYTYVDLALRHTSCSSHELTLPQFGQLLSALTMAMDELGRVSDPHVEQSLLNFITRLERRATFRVVECNG